MKLKDHPRAQAKRRAAMKRWLRARGVRVPAFTLYSESALRKLVRDNMGGSA